MDAASEPTVECPRDHNKYYTDTALTETGLAATRLSSLQQAWMHNKGNMAQATAVAMAASAFAENLPDKLLA